VAILWWTTPLTVKAELAAIRRDARMAAMMLDQEKGLIYSLTERPAFDPIRGDPSLPWLHNPAADRSALAPYSGSEPRSDRRAGSR
jgi:hypothetical protein